MKKHGHHESHGDLKEMKLMNIIEHRQKLRLHIMETWRHHRLLGDFVIRNLTLSQKRSGLCLQPLYSQLQASGICIYTFIQCLAFWYQPYLIMWCWAETLGHVESVDLQRGWKQSSFLDHQLCLCAEDPVKVLDMKTYNLVSGSIVVKRYHGHGNFYKGRHFTGSGL